MIFVQQIDGLSMAMGLVGAVIAVHVAIAAAMMASTPTTQRGSLPSDRSPSVAGPVNRLEGGFSVTSVASPRGSRSVLNSDVFCWDELPDLLAAEELFEVAGNRNSTSPIVGKQDDDEEDDDLEDDEDEDDDDEEEDDLEDDEWEEVEDEDEEEDDEEEEEDEEEDDEEDDEEEGDDDEEWEDDDEEWDDEDEEDEDEDEEEDDDD
jgi:hypothetical protein